MNVVQYKIYYVKNNLTKKFYFPFRKLKNLLKMRSHLPSMSTIYYE